MYEINISQSSNLTLKILKSECECECESIFYFIFYTNITGAEESLCCCRCESAFEGESESGVCNFMVNITTAITA